MLTPRQKQVGSLMIQGYTRKEIAQKLHITLRTMKKHARKMYSRECGDSRVHATTLVRTLFEQRVSQELLPEFAPNLPEGIASNLTEKEMRIIGLVYEGNTNQQIANVVGRTRYGITNSLRDIMDKTGMSGRVELTLWECKRREEIH